MKRLLEQPQADDEAVTSLHVIDKFDQLMEDEADLERLVEFATELTGRPVGADDFGNSRRVRRPRLSDEGAEQREAEAVARAVLYRRLRGRRSELLETDCGPVVAVSAESASGRFGVVWACVAGSPTVHDRLVVERLAHAVAVWSLRQHERRGVASTTQDALGRLLCDSASSDQAGLLARRAGLDTARDYVVVALRERPTRAMSAEAVLAAISAAQRDPGKPARGLVLGRQAVIVSQPGPDLDKELAHVIGEARARGVTLQAGISSAGPVDEAAAKLAEAREALELGGLVGVPRPVRQFTDLGVLHLLAQIPRAAVESSADVRRVLMLAQPDSEPSDLTLLATYCETGSLRQTAARYFLHHSSVDYRIKRIEERLGLPIAQPDGRLHVLVAVRLAQIQLLRED